MTLYQLLADAVLVLHLAFILFVVFGALIALYWRRVIWLHVPCVIWAVIIELSGWICPLTPLENSLRLRAGAGYYEGAFIAHYIEPVVYPAGLTREMQICFALLALAINVAAYWFCWKRGSLRRRAGITKVR